MKVYCNPIWLLGLICVVTGGVLNGLMLPFCDLVLLSTTVGLSIIFSNLLAVRFLGEKLVWKYDLLAFFLVIGGCTAIVLLSKTEEEVLTPDKVKELLFSIPTIAYLSFTIALMVGALISLKLLVKATKDFEQDMHTWLTSVL